MVALVAAMESATVTKVVAMGFLPLARAIQVGITISAKAISSAVVAAGVGGVTWVRVLFEVLGRHSGSRVDKEAVLPSSTKRYVFCFADHVLRM
jgi:hypothetical protein